MLVCVREREREESKQKTPQPKKNFFRDVYSPLGSTRRVSRGSPNLRTSHHRSCPSVDADAHSVVVLLWWEGREVRQGEKETERQTDTDTDTGTNSKGQKYLKEMRR